MKSFILVAGAFVLVVSACASSESVSERDTDTTTSSTTASPGGPRVLVVTITEDGGCFMMGPNCATYRAYSNGTVELTRTREPGEPEDTTTVDPASMAEIQRLLASTDLDTLRSSLPEGECQGCVDGTDTTFTFETPEGQVSFAGTDVELVLTEELFAATWELRNTAAEGTELGMRAWPSG